MRLTHIRHTRTHVLSSFARPSSRHCLFHHVVSSSHSRVDMHLVRPKRTRTTNHLIYWHRGDRPSSTACHQDDCTSPLIIFRLLSSHCHFHSMFLYSLTLLHPHPFNLSRADSCYTQLSFIYSALDMSSVSLLFNAFDTLGNVRFPPGIPFCSVTNENIWL